MLLLIFCSLLFPTINSTVSPCNSKISLVQASLENNKGLIEISVNTSGKFICTLHTEKGIGLEKVSEKTGAGNSVIKFKDLGTESLYLVQVEFLDAPSPRCSKLQLSQIIIE